MNPDGRIAILIPTRNEQENLPFSLRSVCDWAREVFVLDSGSTDCTEAIARELGASFVFHGWEGYARQKNWGLDQFGRCRSRCEDSAFHAPSSVSQAL